MSKIRYVRAIEIVKRGQAEYYDGVEISRTKDNVTIIGCGPDKDDPIIKHTLDLENFIIEESKREDVQHYFKLSLMKTEAEMINKEFDYLEAKRLYEKSKARAAEYVGM